MLFFFFSVGDGEGGLVHTSSAQGLVALFSGVTQEYSGDPILCWGSPVGLVRCKCLNPSSISPVPEIGRALFLFGGHNRQCLGIIPVSAFRNYSWCFLGDHMECQGLNPGWSYAKQASYLLYEIEIAVSLSRSMMLPNLLSSAQGSWSYFSKT